VLSTRFGDPPLPIVLFTEPVVRDHPPPPIILSTKPLVRGYPTLVSTTVFKVIVGPLSEQHVGAIARPLLELLWGLCHSGCGASVVSPNPYLVSTIFFLNYTIL